MIDASKVFIAGSRRLLRLRPEVSRRIDNIIEKGLTVLVGDANGADKAVQTYLARHQYRNVVVFCMAGGCRNNIGGWPIRAIPAPVPTRRDFAHYSKKDREMAREADYGLMLWDGQSRGTLTNAIDLVQRHKPVVLYMAPSNSFHEVREPNQLSQILRDVDPELLATAKNDSESPRYATNHKRSESSTLF
jgi:hypothetical protein